METIAIVGCGRTAAGLVEAAGRAGFSIKLIHADSGEPGSVFLSLEMAMLEGRLTALERDRIFARTELTDDLGALADCGMVIECVEAPLPKKLPLLRRLEAHMTPGAILASHDTQLASLAQGLARPTQFVGMNLPAPFDAESGVEVEPTDDTALGVVDATVRFCADIGRRPIMLPDAAE